MLSDLFRFKLGQRILVENIEYIVTGGIEFKDSTNGYRWVEYSIKRYHGNQIRWLSIDEAFNEYAIYDINRNSGLFNESTLYQNGYHQADIGNASVTSYFGNVDVDMGEKVHFMEYDDVTEEKIMAIEEWDGEVEYSTGHYLDVNQIIATQNFDEATIKKGTSDGAGLLISLFIVPFFIIMFICIIFVIKESGVPKISKHLKNSSSYTYVTSITSDINNKEKADVYRTTKSVDSAAKDIIDYLSGKTEQVQQNNEDDSICLITDKEFCLIYTDTDNKTLVQISTRAYVYQSTNTPYHATHHTHHYYRRCYRSWGYTADHSKYSSKTSGYSSSDSGLDSSSSYSSTYKNYSNSVRQKAAAARTSSGGGLSSGK